MKIQRAIAMLALPAIALSFVPAAVAYDDPLDEVVVTGIGASLEAALDVKRTDAGIVDAVAAEDIGKLPGKNQTAREIR